MAFQTVDWTAIWHTYASYMDLFPTSTTYTQDPDHIYEFDWDKAYKAYFEAIGKTKEKEVNKMKTYTVYEVVFVQAPTKTEEEQGTGARIVSGDVPILVVATSRDAAVAQAGGKAGSADLNSSLTHAVVRTFEG